MKQSFWQSPLTRSSVPKDKVTTPETLLGYLIGPFGCAAVIVAVLRRKGAVSAYFQRFPLFLPFLSRRL